MADLSGAGSQAACAGSGVMADSPTSCEYLGMAAHNVCMAFSRRKHAKLRQEDEAPKGTTVPVAVTSVLKDDWEKVKDCIIFPVSSWKGKWDIMILLFILYSSVSVPIRVCFDADAEGIRFIFEATMSGLFFM